jgi:hypothetical protein
MTILVRLKSPILACLNGINILQIKHIAFLVTEQYYFDSKT